MEVIGKHELAAVLRRPFTIGQVAGAVERFLLPFERQVL